MASTRRKQGRHDEDWSFMDAQHHSGKDYEQSTLNLPPRHPPDPYNVPPAAQTILNVKGHRISKISILNLCQSARVYCNSDLKGSTKQKLKKRIYDAGSPRRVKNKKRAEPPEGVEFITDVGVKNKEKRAESPEGVELVTDVGYPRRAKNKEKRTEPPEVVESTVRRSRKKKVSPKSKEEEPANLNPYVVLPDINGIRRSREE